MAKTTAQLITRQAPLSDDFGRDYATRLFGAEALADLPRFTRGPRAGQLKGWLIWVKAERGGWSRDYGVCRPGLVRAWIGEGQYSGQSQALTGMFLGRVQSLCASESLLGEANRAREAAQRAAEAADRARCWAEEDAERAGR